MWPAKAWDWTKNASIKAMKWGPCVNLMIIVDVGWWAGSGVGRLKEKMECVFGAWLARKSAGLVKGACVGMCNERIELP